MLAPPAVVKAFVVASGTPFDQFPVPLHDSALEVPDCQNVSAARAAVPVARWLTAPVRRASAKADRCAKA